MTEVTKKTVFYNILVALKGPFGHPPSAVFCVFFASRLDFSEFYFGFLKLYMLLIGFT